MHMHKKYIVVAWLAVASASHVHALEFMTAQPQVAGFPAPALLVPVTAAASLSAGSDTLTPAPAPPSSDSFASDVAQASSDFGQLATPAVPLAGAPDGSADTLMNAGAGALPASGPATYGMFLLGAGLILLSGRRRQNDAPWSVTTVQVPA